MLRQEIDAFRTQVLLHGLAKVTGLSTLYALGAALDRKSIWIDAANNPHQSKWYRFGDGLQVPSKRLVAQLRARVPGVAVEIRHAVWRLLRNPQLSFRSLRRLWGQMPADWQDLRTRLEESPISTLSLGARLVRQAQLRELPFLDAIFLFASLRIRAVMAGDREREVALITILYSLPLIYCDDPHCQLEVATFDDSNTSMAERMFTLFDRALGLEGERGCGIQFPVPERVRALRCMHALMRAHRDKHPRGLRTCAERRSFAARHMDLWEGGILYYAFSAYAPASSLPLPEASHHLRPVDERLWRWAWYRINKRRHCRDVAYAEVERVWQSYQHVGRN